MNKAGTNSLDSRHEIMAEKTCCVSCCGLKAGGGSKSLEKAGLEYSSSMVIDNFLK